VCASTNAGSSVQSRCSSEGGGTLGRSLSLINGRADEVRSGAATLGQQRAASISHSIDPCGRDGRTGATIGATSVRNQSARRVGVGVAADDSGGRRGMTTLADPAIRHPTCRCKSWTCAERPGGVRRFRTRPHVAGPSSPERIDSNGAGRASRPARSGRAEGARRDRQRRHKRSASRRSTTSSAQKDAFNILSSTCRLAAGGPKSYNDDP